MYESWDDENHAAEDGYGNDDDDRHTDVPSDSHYPSTCEDPTDWPGIDLGTFLAGSTAWVQRDELDGERLAAYVVKECGSDAQLHEANVGYKEAATVGSSGTRTVFLACCGSSLFWSADSHSWRACGWVERGRWAKARERRGRVRSKAKANAKLTDPIP